jgi:hypothetical protein
MKTDTALPDVTKYQDITSETLKCQTKRYHLNIVHHKKLNTNAELFSGNGPGGSCPWGELSLGGIVLEGESSKWNSPQGQLPR